MSDKKNLYEKYKKEYETASAYIHEHYTLDGYIKMREMGEPIRKKYGEALALLAKGPDENTK